MTELPSAREVAARLDDLMREQKVPGASVAIARGEQRIVHTAGVRRLGSSADVTPDTRFLIASVTKVWTATMVMQLVDEGHIELDEPVNRYLQPKLRLGDPEVADRVTVRQLLCHTGGFFGDADEPEGWNDDAVRQTVDTYESLPQLHRPGTMFSYSNAGYNVLGRLIECVDATTWDSSLERRLLQPLQLRDTSSLINRTATHAIAVGHEPRGPDTLELEPVQEWLDPRGSGPCGGTLATTSEDLVRFGMMHARDGRGPAGRVLSAESARLMRTPAIDQPDPSEAGAWSLGWAVVQPDGPTVVEHGGNTCGQHSQLIVVPDLDLAMCVLANGDTQGKVRASLLGWLLEELAAAHLPAMPRAAPTQSDEAWHFSPAGRYERDEDLAFLVGESENGMTLHIATSGAAADRVAPTTVPLVPSAIEGTYLFTMPPMTEQTSATILSEDGADPTHLAIGLRVAPKVGA